MKLIIILLSMLLTNCNSSKSIRETKNYKEGSFLITKIEQVNNWNVIYAKNQKAKYKIVSGVNNTSDKNCVKIEVGKYYNLKLNSRKGNVPEINGIKIKPVNDIDIDCYTYDEETNICIVPDNGIYDLYHTDNIKGLCYIK